MGRYTSVQAYADNNANVRSIPYAEATGGAEKKSGGVVTEKVSNPYGSTAGAGSGEFHVYRHARAREAARWKELDDSEQQALEEQQFEEELQHAHDEEAQKTGRRRKKRQREKEAKQRKKHLKAAGILTSSGQAANMHDEGETAGDGEFTYVPDKDRQENEEPTEKAAKDQTKQSSDSVKESASASPPVEELPNDGSFLELMKKKLEAEQGKKGQGTYEDQEDEGPIMPPPSKRMAIETRIIDEDDEEGPMPLL
jgi:hypothetical protein